MKSQELPVKSNVNVTLKTDSEQLEEVVVVAYGTAKKESLTGSVSVVDAKKIEQRITTSVTGALEGSAPGIQVNNSYGEPGSNPSIRIRGFGTISTNAGAADPLYVVDGVPFDGNISDLNSSDIESMSVLKDAASSALYGNRAANGVVLITTKKGKEYGKTSISLNVNQGIYNRGIAEYDRLGADQWMEAEWTGLKNYAMTLSSLQLNEADASLYASEHLIGDLVKKNIYDAADNALFDSNGRLTAKRLAGYDDLDWAKELERNGHRQEYTLSATTSGEKFNVYSSVGYLKENGYIISTSFERFSGRINSTYNPTKWLKTGVNLSATTQVQNYNSNAYGSYLANPFYTSRYLAPVYSIYTHNADGSYALDENGNKQYDLTSSYLTNRHIIYELYNDQEDTRRNTLGGQAFATINLPFDIDATIKGDLSHRTSNSTKYNNPNIGDGATNNGRLTNYAYQYRTYNVQELLNWKHDFGKHHIDLMLGHENYAYLMKVTYGMNTSMSISGNHTMGNFTTNSYYQGYDEEYKTESYLSRARYNYDEKYYFSASLRTDGSSRFHKDHRWGTFWSIGGNWRISKEAFMEDVKWVDNLSLKLSYGQQGNDNILSGGVSNYYLWQSLYDLGWPNSNQIGGLVSSLENQAVSWEKNGNLNVGIEATLLNSRLTVNAEYYNRKTVDMLLSYPMATSTGFNGYNANVGDMRNSGFEFEVRGTAIKTDDFTWNISLMGSTVKNKVLKLTNTAPEIIKGVYSIKEGMPINTFYMAKSAGVDPATGAQLYWVYDKDENGNIINERISDDYSKASTSKYYLGSRIPDLYGSIGTDFSYKGFDLSILTSYSIGGKIYDGLYMGSMNAQYATNTWNKHQLRRWQKPGDITDVPRVEINGSYTTTDRFLVDASYFAIKNITLGYSLPKDWMRKAKLGNVRVFGSIDNLALFSHLQGMDPQYSFKGETDYSYAPNKTYSFGVEINF